MRRAPSALPTGSVVSSSHSSASAPDGVGLRGQGGTVAPSPEPARGPALLGRPAAPAAALGAVELDARNPERDAPVADGQRAVHVDAESARTLPAVARDHARPVAAVMRREVEIRAVLDQKDGPGTAHAPHRPLPVARQDALRRQSDMLVVRFRDHPVVPRHQGLVAAGRREERLRRRRRLDSGARHEPVPQPAVQRSPAELVHRPAAAVKPVAGTEDGERARRRFGAGAADAQRAAPAGLQRTQPHRFRLNPLPGHRPPPASRAVAGIGPSRRAQAAAAIACPHEGLGQQRPDAVARAEVVPEAAQAQRKRLRRQVPAQDAVPDQEPRHADDPVEPRRTACRVPADPGVPGGQPRRRAGEHEPAEPAVLRADQVPQLPARVLRRAERMVVRRHPGQQQALGLPADGSHFQPAHTAHPRRHADRLRHRRGPHPRRPCHALPGTLGRKPQRALRLERGQRRHAARGPWTPLRVDKAEALADRPGDRHASRKPVGRPEAGQECLPGLGPEERGNGK